MASIRIKVGASLDASANTVFQPLERAAARARSKIEKELDKAAKEAMKLEAASQKAAEKMDRELEREANKILREEEKAQRARTKVVERETAQRVRLEQRAAREVAAATAREEREIAASAARAQRVSEREAAAAARASDRSRRRMGREALTGLGTSMRLIRGGASLALGGAESLLEGMGVDLSLASHLGNAQDFQQRIVEVVNAGYIPGAQGAQGVLANKEGVATDVKAAANAGAVSYNEAAEGLQKFVGLTGDLATGRALLKQTAELARATGADFVQMSEATAEVSNHLGPVPDKAGAVSAVMRVIAGQGKLGALEIKDFARQMAKIAANAPKFEGDVGKTIGDLALMAQEAKMQGGAANAAQAATAVLNFATGFSTPTTFKHWQAAGLNPFTDKTHTTLRSPEELVLEAMKYSKGDQLKIRSLFPNIRAQTALNPYAKIYSETKGTDKQKLQAVANEFDRMRQAQLDAAEVQRAYTETMGTSKSAVQLANNKLDDLAGKIQNAMLPAIAGLVPAIEAMTPAVTAAVEGFGHLLSQLTGAETKNAEEAAEKAGGKLAGDEELLERTKKKQFVPGKGMVPVYSGEELDVIRAHGAARSSAIGGLEGQIAQKQKDFDEHSHAIPWLWTRTYHALGMSSPAEKAEQDKAEIAKLTELRDKAVAEATQSNELLSRIYGAIKEGNAIRTQKPPPAPTPGGSMPADSE